MNIRDTAAEYAAARILIVEDNETSANVLERLLRSAGYREIMTVTDSRQVLPLFREFDPESNIVDAHVARVRNKLREIPDSPQIETSRGFGFILKTDGLK